MFERVMLKGEFVVGCLFASALVYDEKSVGVLVTLLPWLMLLIVDGCFFCSAYLGYCPLLFEHLIS